VKHLAEGDDVFPSLTLPEVSSGMSTQRSGLSPDGRRRRGPSARTRPPKRRSATAAVGGRPQDDLDHLTTTCAPVHRDALCSPRCEMTYCAPLEPYRSYARISTPLAWIPRPARRRQKSSSVRTWRPADRESMFRGAGHTRPWRRDRALAPGAWFPKAPAPAAAALACEQSDAILDRRQSPPRYAS
jgi:hypothetical protein